MHFPIILLASIAVCTTFVGKTFGQSAKDIRGASPLVAIENEAPAKLIVDPPLPNRWPRGGCLFSTEPTTFEWSRFSAREPSECNLASVISMSPSTTLHGILS